LKRALGEPVLHFFILGALLFLAHRLVVGDARTIVVGPGVKADVVRRFRDERGRAPSAAEADQALRDWKRDEALFREALRTGLDKNDRAIRTILIDKLRARALVEVPPRQPTEAELAQWLAQHRSLYETARRYAVDWIPFARAQPSAAAEREKVDAQLTRSADTRLLGRPVFGANLTVDELRERLGDGVAGQVAGLPLGRWQRSESATELLLVRVNEVQGGLPPASELRPRLLVDWTAAIREQEAAKALQKLADQYRFEER
jgi:hypothetical protein